MGCAGATFLHLLDAWGVVMSEPWLLGLGVRLLDAWGRDGRSIAGGLLTAPCTHATQAGEVDAGRSPPSLLWRRCGWPISPPASRPAAPASGSRGGARFARVWLLPHREPTRGLTWLLPRRKPARGRLWPLRDWLARRRGASTAKPSGVRVIIDSPVPAADTPWALFEVKAARRCSGGGLPWTCSGLTDACTRRALAAQRWRCGRGRLREARLVGRIAVRDPSTRSSSTGDTTAYAAVGLHVPARPPADRGKLLIPAQL